MTDKRDDTEIKAIISSELSQTTGSLGDIEGQRQLALKYYLGDMEKSADGRSNVVSTDVADAIEWIMPELMKAFTQNNQVVTFDPVGPNDSRQAEIESQFVYDTLMKNNSGYVILHTFFKDALMQKNGFVKCFYSEDNKVISEDYVGITTPELQMILSDSEVELTGQTTEIENGIDVHSINIKRTKLKGSVIVSAVAPENLRIYARHNSVDLSQCRFIAETTMVSRSDLVKQGFDRELVYEYRCDDEEDNSSYRFSYQGETSVPYGASGNPAPETELLEVTEAYMFLDINDDGIAEYVKITYLGDDEPKEILEIVEIDENPYVSSTAIMMSHKLFGLSVYDRLKQLQDIKTALWRNMLDNMYLQNNQRTIVQEGMVNLDDLLSSRPGGIIRAKTPNAVTPFPTTPLSSDSYNMLGYLDKVSAGRVGVSPDGSINDVAMGDSVGSEGVAQLLTQKEELVGLMVRSFAETGIKPLCIRIRDLLIKNHNLIDDYEFRGEWVKVNPTGWMARNNTTVRVGTGSGNRKQQAAALMQIMAFQSQIVAMPGQALVNENKVFAALNDFVKTSGLPGAAPYFLDPGSPEGMEFKQQVDASSQEAKASADKEKQLLTQVQTTIAQAEQTKANAAIESVQVKGQNERLKTELSTLKGKHETQISMLQQELSEAQLQLKDVHHTEDLQFKYEQLQQQYDIAMAQLNNSDSKDSKDD
jgi:hypothetical protein